MEDQAASLRQHDQIDWSRASIDAAITRCMSSSSAKKYRQPYR